LSCINYVIFGRSTKHLELRLWRVQRNLI